MAARAGWRPPTSAPRTGVRISTALVHCPRSVHSALRDKSAASPQGSLRSAANSASQVSAWAREAGEGAGWSEVAEESGRRDARPPVWSHACARQNRASRESGRGSSAQRPAASVSFPRTAAAKSASAVAGSGAVSTGASGVFGVSAECSARRSASGGGGFVPPSGRPGLRVDDGGAFFLGGAASAPRPPTPTPSSATNVSRASAPPRGTGGALRPVTSLRRSIHINKKCATHR